MARAIDFSRVTTSRGCRGITLSQFCAGWIVRRESSRKSWDTDASRIRTYFVPSPLWTMRLDRITPGHIAAILEALITAGLSAATVRRTYSLLSVIFKDAAVRGHIGQAPCILGPEHLPRASRMAARNKVLTIAELRILVAGSPISRGVLYLACFTTGARIGELSGLNWADYGRERQPLGCLSVVRQYHTGRGRIEHSTKTGVPKFLPVHPALAAALALWRFQWSGVVGQQPRPTSPIFVTQIKKQHWRADSFRNIFKRDLKRLGLDSRHTPHDFRHSFITHARAAGVDAQTVRKITHPSPRDIMDLYTHHDWAQLCAAVASIELRGLKLAV